MIDKTLNNKVFNVLKEFSFKTIINLLLNTKIWFHFDKDVNLQTFIKLFATMCLCGSNNENCKKN